MAEPIFVTRPSLPELPDVVAALERIWDSRILSNRGPHHGELEARLESLVDGPRVSLACNGMIALEAVLSAANLQGEVITTPYSFVATSHAIVRSGLTPVFADIEPGGFNIDPDRVESAITDRTSAILAVHCYGYPCDHDRLAAIAEKRGLTLIYDAAHAFGVTLNGRQVIGLGDFAAVSFHATKAFNTFEGGLAVCENAEHKAAVDLWLNFGIASESEIPTVGTNGKMSEFNAAIGMLQLDRIEAYRAGRAIVDARYRDRLGSIEGLEIPPIPAGVVSNHSYFPVLVADGQRDRFYEVLKEQGIFARRYFWPLLSNLESYRHLPSALEALLPNANRAAERILCLPIYPDLPEGDQDRIVDAIRKAMAE